MSNEKLSNEAQSPPLSKAGIISRIYLISGISMQTELFEKLRDELADTMIETMGFDTISKFLYFLPSGKYWQLQYGL